MQDSFVLEFTFSIPEINKSLKPAAIEIVLIGTRESLLKRNRKRIELAKPSRISTHNAEVLGGQPSDRYPIRIVLSRRHCRCGAALHRMARRSQHVVARVRHGGARVSCRYLLVNRVPISS